MKKVLILIYAILLCFLLLSCDSKEIINQEPDYGVRIPNKVDFTYSDLTSEQEDNEWGILSDFEGIESEYSTPEFGNLGINIKMFGNDWLVCPDKEGDGAYFVNYNKDNYIYHYKDGKATLLVDMKARNLMLYGNQLYFLSEHEDNSNVYLKPHNIYKYNLDTKETSMVLETNATWLFVSSDGVYYVSSEEKPLGNDDYSIIEIGYCYKDNKSQKTNFTKFIPFRDYIFALFEEGYTK